MTSDRVGIPFAIFVSLVSFAIRAVRVSVRYRRDLLTRRPIRDRLRYVRHIMQRWGFRDAVRRDI